MFWRSVYPIELIYIRSAVHSAVNTLSVDVLALGENKFVFTVALFRATIKSTKSKGRASSTP